jgi:lipoate-protein ligase A
MKSLRIVDTGLAPARWNVAMTAALAELHSTHAIGDTVRFHRYPRCVLLGAGQDMQSAVDLEHCQRAGIAIARRITGGGAVYMSPDMLAWDVVVDRAAGGSALEAVTRRVCHGVAAGLSRLGAKACFRPPNDIVIGDRKISGSSGYAIGHSAVLQGTVLLENEIPDMAGALGLPQAALRERITCLEIEMGEAPALAAVVDAISGCLAEALGRGAMPGGLRQDELALCETLLRDEIGDEDYVLGQMPAPE